MRKLFQPLHPGLTIRDDILPALGLSVSAAAKQLCIARGTLSKVINGKVALSPEMALRIEKWLGTENGGRADLWLAEQVAYDLWQARSNFKENIQQIQYLHTETDN